MHLRVRRIDSTMPKTMYPSSSAITYWQLEKERGPLDGEEILWDDYLRIRHAVTRQYLSIDESNHNMKMRSTTSPDTLFRFTPVVKASSLIS